MGQQLWRRLDPSTRSGNPFLGRVVCEHVRMHPLPKGEWGIGCGATVQTRGADGQMFSRSTVWCHTHHRAPPRAATERVAQDGVDVVERDLPHEALEPLG